MIKYIEKQNHWKKKKIKISQKTSKDFHTIFKSKVKQIVLRSFAFARDMALHQTGPEYGRDSVAQDKECGLDETEKCGG